LVSPRDASLSVDDDQGLVCPTRTDPNSSLLFDISSDEEQGMVKTTVYLPAGKSLRSVPSNVSTKENRPNRQLKILIVDDSITNRKLEVCNKTSPTSLYFLVINYNNENQLQFQGSSLRRIQVIACFAVPFPSK
jgi:hypothetical protein